MDARFIVVAFPFQASLGNDTPIKPLPTFVWGKDHYTPSIPAKWIKLKRSSAGINENEYNALLLTSAEACKVRDAGIINELCDEYSFQIIEVKDALPPAK